MTTRRRFLSSAIASTALTSMDLSARLRAVCAPLAPPATLKDAGAARRLLVGCAVDIHHVRDDPPYAGLIRQQSAIIVPNNALKFGPLRPTPTTFFFDDADDLVHFARSSGMKVRGHNFVWHISLPTWFDTYVTAQNAEHMLVDHIETVAGRYAGRIHSWDVANECILLDDNLPGGLRNSPWYKVLGPRYLDIAFTTARRADPKALLVYNEYGIESENPSAQKKRDAVLQLLRDLKARHIPIDALGIQSHITAGSRLVYGPGFINLMAAVHQLGLKVLFTEMDVNDSEIPPEITQRDEAVAARYTEFLSVALQSPAVIALLTWGITDKYTWLIGKRGRKDGLPERPLPFDAELQPKPAFTAIMSALAAAQKRK